MLSKFPLALGEGDAQVHSTPWPSPPGLCSLSQASQREQSGTEPHGVPGECACQEMCVPGNVRARGMCVPGECVGVGLTASASCLQGKILWIYL